MSNNKKVVVVAAAVCVISMAVFLVRELSGGPSDDKLLARIKDKPELVEKFNKAIAEEEKIKATPDDTIPYLNAGLAWKGIGELSGDEDFFKRALLNYENGAKKFGNKNLLFYWNTGKVAERLNDTAKAERYYQLAIDAFPQDEVAYIYMAELYIYKLNKSKDEVLAIFSEALKKEVASGKIIAARAEYLKKAGDYEKALEDYKMLSESYPDNQGYKDVIVELENKIKR